MVLSEGCPCDSFTLGKHTLGVEDTFCYLGDTVSGGGGCKYGKTARTRSTWKSFGKLKLFLTNYYTHIRTRGKNFCVCVRFALLYGREHWTLRKEDTVRLERKDRSMLR